MALAHDDPAAFGSSLVLRTEELEAVDPRTRRPLLDSSGNPQPPIWRPLELLASDLVDEADSVHNGILNAQPGAVVRLSTPRLDRWAERMHERTSRRVGETMRR